MLTSDTRLPSIENESGMLCNSFRLQPIGLLPVGEPTFEQWFACGSFLCQAENAVHFWIGDWLNFGEWQWGERYTGAIELTGFDYQTVANDKWVASRIEISRRREKVSFEHHKEVAPLSPHEQDVLLARAEAEGWTVRRLREEKRLLARIFPYPRTDISDITEQEQSTASFRLNSLYCGDALSVLQTFPDTCCDLAISSPPYWHLRDYEVEGQLGLEETFEEYIQKLCDVFDEVMRVLRPWGTCWVNMGDTYASTPAGNTVFEFEGTDGNYGRLRKRNSNGGRANTAKPIDYGCVQHKSLCLIPFRFAIEMVNRGWILRNTVIWHKPNVMPESAKDRFTEDFEYLFFFVKSQQYYFERQYEPLSEAYLERAKYPRPQVSKWDADKKRNRASYLNKYDTFTINPLGRNMRTVWSIPPKPLKEAHFAVFPEELIETPIKASCPAGGIVLDPYIGAGTTAIVAQRLGRNYIGIDLKPEYIALAQERLAKYQQEVS